MLKWSQFKRRSTRLPWYHVLVWWTIVPYLICKPILWFFYRARWHGTHNIPRTGPALFVSNHQSHFDPVLVGVPISDRCPRSLARSTLKTDSRFWGWFIGYAFDSIWLKQGKGDAGAMKAALNELKEGRVSVIYPEGARTPDGSLKAFQRGAFLLIKRGMAPVIPVAVEGGHDAWPAGRPKPKLRGRIMVMYGDPIPAELLVDMGPEGAMEHVRDIIEGMRLDMRARIRKASRGRSPAKGPGDEDCRLNDPGAVT